MLRIALLGAGHICEKMATTLDALRNEVIPYAVGARDLDRARAFAQRFRLEKAYGSYAELVADPAVDLVYVGTPNSHHFEHVRLCLEHGKHVLCEKPFTANAAQAEALFAMAAERGLFLQEAIWTRFLPAIKRMQEEVAAGVIGEPRFIEAAFSAPIRGKERVISPALGGGTLLDLGIYPLTFALLFFGEGYSRLSGTARLTETGVDEQESFTLEYPDGRMASLTSSMCALSGAWGRLSGTKGRIEADPLVRCQGYRVVRADGSVRTVSCPFDHTGYEYEVRACAAAIAAGRTECEEATHLNTLFTLHTMDALRRLWGVRFPFEQ